MDAVTVPAGSPDALDLLESVMGSLADADPAGLGEQEVARRLRALERLDAIEAAVRGRLLEVFDARDGHLADGQRTARTWLVHVTRVTGGQAGEHRALQPLARDHPVLLAALAEGWVLTKSVALQLAKWTRAIPDDYRAKAEEILVGAARAGAGLRALAAICAEIRYRTAQPDPEDENDRHLDRGVSFETTLDGAGVVRGDLTPQCAAMVQAVLDALSAPAGGGDLRTRPQRYHDALAEAMRRLLASDLLPEAGRAAGQGPGPHLPRRAPRQGRRVGPARHVDHRVPGRWAAHRAAASVSTGPGGAASFLRRNLLGQGLNGPSLPLDVGQP